MSELQSTGDGRMSCEYCRGEKLLYEGEVPQLLDGRAFSIGCDAKIARGHFLGSHIIVNGLAVSGISCEIEYCPKCGDKTLEWLKEEAKQ